ncbi:MAG TPA: hypothetical protein VFP93_00230, partial [Gammaproteobacteria bacterium]|nr:hypothetical protein [Gammaproteobacteria bacterium]
PCHIAKPNKLKKILQLNFDGIELYSANINKDKVSWLEHQIKNTKFFVTGGSDFHKKQSPLHLGISYTSEEIFGMLQQKCAENNKALHGN